MIKRKKWERERERDEHRDNESYVWITEWMFSETNVLFPEINAHGIFYNGALGWIAVLDFLQSALGQRFSRYPGCWWNAKLRYGSVPLFFKEERWTQRASNPLSSDFRFGWTARFHSFRKSAEFLFAIAKLSLSLSLSFPLSNILSISTRRERDRGKDTRFLISEAFINRSLYPLSLRLPFPRYYFVAVSDPFTKQSR